MSSGAIARTGGGGGGGVGGGGGGAASGGGVLTAGGSCHGLLSSTFGWGTVAGFGTGCIESSVSCRPSISFPWIRMTSLKLESNKPGSNAINATDTTCTSTEIISVFPRFGGISSSGSFSSSIAVNYSYEQFMDGDLNQNGFRR